MTYDDDERSWRYDASCANLPEAQEVDFYSEEIPEIKKAKSICMDCPVRRQCLEEALSIGDHWGVWGGVDEEGRRRALSINKDGHPTVRAVLPKCPYCGNKLLNSVEKRRNRTLVQCSNEACKFTWWTRRSMPKRVEKAKP